MRIPVNELLTVIYRSASSQWAVTFLLSTRPSTLICQSCCCWLEHSSLPGSLCMRLLAPSLPETWPRSSWLPLLLPSSWALVSYSLCYGLEYMSRHCCLFSVKYKILIINNIIKSSDPGTVLQAQSFSVEVFKNDFE